MWGARVRIISTHNGVNNDFNQLIQDARAGRKNYSIHRITLDDALKDGLYVVDRLPRLIFGKLDATGNGAYLAEQARHKYGSQRVQEIKISNQWYLENMPKLKAVFEDQAITIPASDDVASDLNALQIIDGIIKLPAVKNESKEGLKRHGDSAIAIAMAYSASLENGGEIDYIDVPSSRWGDDDDYDFFS